MTPTFAALADPASTACSIAALLAAAAMLVAPRERMAACFALAAGALAPLALLFDLSGSPQLDRLAAQPAKLAVGAVAGAAALAAVAWLIRRRPEAIAWLTAATLPFRVPLELGGDTANLLVPLYLVVGGGTLAWITTELRDRSDREHRPDAVEVTLAATLALFAVAILWSLDRSKATQQAAFFLVPFSLIFAQLRRVEWTRELLRACGLILVALALAFSAVAFYEYWTETLLLNPRLLISNQFHTYFRVNSVFFDPNMFGRFLMLVIIGLAAVILDTDRTKAVVAATAASAVLLAAMVMTLSQSSLLGLVAGLVTLAALRWSAKVIATLAVLGLVAGAVAVIALPSAGRFPSLKSLNTQSSGRASLVNGGVQLFTERPIAGWGSGSFSRAYRNQRRAGSPAAVTASHTTPVTIAAEQGVLGLIAYVALLVAGFRAALRRARMSTARAAVTAGMVALILHTFTYAAFLEDPAMWVLLALAVALPIPQTREERRSEREAKRAAVSR